jgi:RNA polymerase sigma-70 factor (ECF subfamily)
MPSSDELATSLGLLRDLCEPSERERAWCIFLERYRPLIDGWCYRAGLKHDDIEEISSAILAKLATTMLTFVYDPNRRFRAWLRIVVMNEVRTLWRQRRIRPWNQGSGNPDLQDQLEEVESPDCIDELEKELDETLGRELQKAHRVAARVRERVKEHTWQAYWQTVIENEKAETVADKLGMTLASVYQAKTRVSKLLREEGTLFQSQAEHGGTGEP